MFHNDAILLYENIFLWEKGLHRRFVSSTGGVDVPITNGSRYEPAVMGAHHQRLPHASPPVYEPAVMNPLHHRRFWNRRWWPRYHHRLKSNGTQNRWWCTFRTGGDRGGCSSVLALKILHFYRKLRFPNLGLNSYASNKFEALWNLELIKSGNEWEQHNFLKLCKHIILHSHLRKDVSHSAHPRLSLKT